MRKSSAFISFIAIPILLSTYNALGQNHHFIQHYTNENGLPANGITGIELDEKNGFLWVGTQAGLVRFDGKNFKHFGSSQKNAVPSRIAFIAKNREGTIYCEEDNFSIYRVVQNEAEWITTDSFFVPRFIYRGGSNPALPLKELIQRLRNAKRSAFLPQWIVFHEEAGDSSNFSVSCFDYVYHYDAAEDTLFSFRGFDAMLKVAGQVYYLRDGLELWEFDSTGKALSPVHVKGMPHWEKNTDEKPKFIWTPGMKEPVLLFQKDMWKLQKAGNELSLLPVCQQCIPADEDISSAQIWEGKGLIFLGSTVNGLYSVKTSFFHSIGAATSTRKGRAHYGQVEVVPGIVTTSSGLTYSDKGDLYVGETVFQFPSANIYQDHRGDCWYANGDTIVHFSSKNYQYSKIEVNDGASQFVFAETQKRLFVVSDKAIAEIVDNRYRLRYKLPFNPEALDNTLLPTAAIEWKPGILAIASKKLLFFDTEKGTAPDTIPIPGLSAQVRSVMKYGRYLFIGTYGQGFYVYKDGRVKKMPLDKNGYLSYAHCFLKDDSEYCWISTNHGLFKASMNALIKAYEYDLNEIYYQYFGKSDGIYNTEFNGGCQPCGLKLSNGRFSLPTMNGVVLFDPSYSHPPPPSGQIFIDEIVADSVAYISGDLSPNPLPHECQELRFKLALPQFDNAENIYFSYKLEPYHTEWQSHDIGQNNTIQFGGLKPGKFTLRLRVRNGFEPNQFGVATINFSISKPWYQESWFYLLSLLGIISFIWGIVKWRTAKIAKRKEELQRQVTMQTQSLEEQSRQLQNQLQQLQNQQIKLEEDNEIKSRLIGIISHDMISPLKFMGHMSSKLKTALVPSDPNYDTVDFISTIAQELELLSVNILNWIKFHHGAMKMHPELFGVRQLVSESTEIASILAKQKGVKFYNDVPEHLKVFQYRQAIGVIIYNLAMNAIKYTQVGEIRISCQLISRSFRLTIADTGIGMPPALVTKLNLPDPYITDYAITQTSKYQFGYVIIKDLLQLAGGLLSVKSVLTAGTQVSIEFSLANNDTG